MLINLSRIGSCFGRDPKLKNTTLPIQVSLTQEDYYLCVPSVSCMLLGSSIVIVGVLMLAGVIACPYGGILLGVGVLIAAIALCFFKQNTNSQTITNHHAHASELPSIGNKHFPSRFFDFNFHQCRPKASILGLGSRPKQLPILERFMSIQAWVLPYNSIAQETHQKQSSSTL